MREGGRISLPAMHRGLSPEGRRIRERNTQGSLTIGVQGVTVHPTERVSRSQNSFLQENVRRLREIQAKCRDRQQPNRRNQPLRATRVKSANTNPSATYKTDGHANAASHVMTGEGEAGRGESAHSDYYSLSEDPLDPPPPTHKDSQGWAADLTHTKHKTSSRPQSPILQRSPTTSPLQPLYQEQHPILPDAGLNKKMRKLRMDNLVSRITSQRPACEMDYHQHYRTIENQHRLLLDAAERINSSSGDAGSSEDSTRGRRGQTSVVTPPKIIRSYSFDRGIQARKREGSAERKVKACPPGELKTLKKPHHRPCSPSPSSSSYSSSHPSRSSKIISKTGQLIQDTNREQDVIRRQRAGSGTNAMGKSTGRGELKGSDVMVKAKNDLDQASPDTQSSGIRVPSYSGSLWNDTKQDVLDAASLSGEMNLNSTFSSSCDFYTGGHEEAESPRHTIQEDLKLAIRRDSQSTEAGGDHSANDLNQNDWDLVHDDQHFLQNGNEDLKDQAVHPHVAENTQYDLFPVDQTDVAGCKKHSDTKEDKQIDNPNSLDEVDVHHPQIMAASPPMLNTSGDEAAASAVTNKTSKPSKREQHQQQRTHGNTLRRSQSLKNITHKPGEPPPSYQMGKIPRYLQIRKEEKRRQEELAQAIDPDCPPGHQPLPDHERLNTLHLLHKSQIQVLKELSSLPVAQDTLRVKRARIALEEKLTQIEEGLRIFSQPRVYIMNDD